MCCSFFYHLFTAKGHEKDIIADINKSFEKVVRTREDEASKGQ